MMLRWLALGTIVAASAAAQTYPPVISPPAAGGVVSGSSGNFSSVSATSIQDSGLTSGSVVFASNGGLLKTDPGMTYNANTDAVALLGNLSVNNAAMTFQLVGGTFPGAVYSDGSFWSYVLTGNTWFWSTSANTLSFNGTGLRIGDTGLAGAQAGLQVSGTLLQNIATLTAATSTTNLNILNANNYNVVLTTATTISLTGAVPSGFATTGQITLQQTSPAVVVNWGAGTLYAGGVSPTLTASPTAVDVLSYYTSGTQKIIGPAFYNVK